MTEDDLVEQSKISNKAIYYSVRSSGDSEVALIVFQKTLEERDAGWLRGLSLSMSWVLVVCSVGVLFEAAEQGTFD